MLRFHVQEYERCANYILPACSLAAGRHIDQTFGVLDLKGVGLRHLTGDVKRMLTRVMSVDQDNFPEMMGHTCIINAPSVFKAIWAFVRPMLDARTQAKVEVCPAKFAPSLLRWVAPENLPEYLGGQSAATLLDDSGPWQVSFFCFCFGDRFLRGEFEGEGSKQTAKEKEKKDSLSLSLSLSPSLSLSLSLSLPLSLSLEKKKKMNKKLNRTRPCSPPSRPPRPLGKGADTRAATKGASPRKTRKEKRRGKKEEVRKRQAGDASSRSRARRAFRQ